MGQAADALIGITIADRYRVVRKLGQGGMGTIYECVHLKLKRSFALKRLAASLADNEDAMSRFQREAEVVASLRHPNIVEISDWETLPDGSPCMILELLRGEDLGARLERGPLPWEAILRIADQAFSALSVTHRATVIHRDLKPHNIFLAIDDAGEERVKILDFGISKISDSSALTGSQVFMGTPAYMSPEQAYGRSADVGPSTDVWAMGAILYEMATGRRAYDADNIPATLLRITSGKFDAIESLRPDAPPAFVAAVLAAMSLDPVERIQSIDDLRWRLRSAFDPRASEPSLAWRTSQPSIPFIATLNSGGKTPLSTPPRGATTLSHAMGEDTRQRAAVRRRRSLLWIAPAIAAIGGVAAFAIVSGKAETARPAVVSVQPTVSPPAPPAPPVDAIDVVDAVDVTAPAAVAAIDAPVAPPATPPVAPAPPLQAMVSPEGVRDIQLVVVPSTATIRLDGTKLSGALLHLPIDGHLHTIVVSAPGYEPERRTVDGKAPAKLRFTLHPSTPTAPTGPRPLPI